MAEEVLVKDALTDRMIEAGASVVQLLRARNFPVDAAFWLYLDVNRWRLMLATPGVRLNGPLKAYRHLIRALGDEAMQGLTVEDMAVIDSRDPLVKLLRGATRKDRSGPGTRFSRSAINGHFIEDAYVYRTAA